MDAVKKRVIAHVPGAEVSQGGIQLPGGGVFGKAGNRHDHLVAGVEMPAVRLVVFFQETGADRGG
jgi:hypothetical protein